MNLLNDFDVEAPGTMKHRLQSCHFFLHSKTLYFGKTIHLTYIFENHCPWTAALDRGVSISDSFSFLLCLAARIYSFSLNAALNVFVHSWAALFEIIFPWAARNCSFFCVNVAVPGQHKIADFPLGLSYCLSQFVSFRSQIVLNFCNPLTARNHFRCYWTAFNSLIVFSAVYSGHWLFTRSTI